MFPLWSHLSPPLRGEAPFSTTNIAQALSVEPRPCKSESCGGLSKQHNDKHQRARATVSRVKDELSLRALRCMR